MDDLDRFVSPARWVGHPIELLGSTGSTNDDARALAARGWPTGTLVVANTQTAGRGRRGRVWASPPGDNLYISLVLRPPGEPSSLGPLPLVVGLAVAEALERFVSGRKVRVKWPNDVRIDGAKLAGVLVESSVSHGGISSVIVGIGVNVLGEGPPPGLSQQATSLRAVRGGELSRAEVLGALLMALETRLDALAFQGFAGMLQAAVAARCESIGARVRVDEITGVGVGIGTDGALRVHTATGGVVEVRAGDVTEESPPTPG